MYVGRGLAIVALLAAVGCDGSPTRTAGEPEAPTGPVEPRLAQAASTGCPNRCGIAVAVAPGGGQPRVLRVTETARLLGQYEATAVRFTWDLKNGTRTTVLAAAEGGSAPVLASGNDWGQSAGTVRVPAGAGSAQLAAAWEPGGTLVQLRASDGSRLAGRALAINDGSVIVGSGQPVPETGDARPFRSHWRDGFLFLTPPGTLGQATDVTGNGTVVGHYATRTAGGVAGATWFLWTPETGRQDMGPGVPVAISETGWVVGTSGSGGFVRSPEGRTAALPAGWRPVDVNQYGEVALQATTGGVLAAGDCGGAVWFRDYGLRRLQSPVTGADACTVASINSWGDVAGTVTREVFTTGSRGFEHTAAVWTWQSNRYRYAQ